MMKLKFCLLSKGKYTVKDKGSRLHTIINVGILDVEPPILQGLDIHRPAEIPSVGNSI